MIKFNLGNCYTDVSVESNSVEEQIIKSICTLKFVNWIRAIECPSCHRQFPSYGYIRKKQTITCKNCNIQIPVAPNLKTVRQIKELNIYKDNKIPTGALIQLVKELTNNNIKFEIQDSRVNLPCFQLDHKAYPLRPYQADAVKMALHYKRGVIHLAPGAGKTTVAFHIICSTAIPALFIVPTLQLLDQTYDNFKEWSTVAKVGKIGDNIFEPSDITVATAQTLNSRIDTPEMKEFLNSIRTVVCDEAHRLNKNKDFIENTWYNIAQSTPNAYFRFGMTATPGEQGSVERSLLEFSIGNIIYHKPLEELVSEGWLVEPIVDLYTVNHIPDEDLRTYSELESKHIIENSQRNELIAKLAEQYAKEGTVLISINKIKHGKLLCDLIKDSEYLDGKSKTELRRNLLHLFKTGEIRILVTTLLKEGADIPALQTIINAGGGAGGRNDPMDNKSGKLVIQRAGRALRTSEGKTNGRVIDFIDKGVKMLQKHSTERKKTYETAGFKVNKIKKDM